jgi:hypothetical protein
MKNFGGEGRELNAPCDLPEFPQRFGKRSIEVFGDRVKVLGTCGWTANNLVAPEHMVDGACHSTPPFVPNNSNASLLCSLVR